MRLLLTIPIVILALAFELFGRVLGQISEFAMGTAIMLLSAVNGKKET